MRTPKINMLLVIMVATSIFYGSPSRGQGMAVNTTGATAATSAILDVSSVTQGVLVPRMTSAQRTLIGTPATGLLVYQTDGTTGFYFYTGSAWALINALANVTTQGNTFNGAGQLLQTDGTGPVSAGNLGSGTANSSTYLRGDHTWQTIAAGATVTNVTAGNLSPLFTTSVTTGSTTPSLSYSLSNAPAYTVLTNSVSATGTPAFSTVVPPGNTGGTANSSSFYRGDGQWAAPLTLTTSGSGAATFTGGVLNIPTPSGSTSSGTVDLIANLSTTQVIAASTTATMQFNSTIVSPTLGSYNTGSYSYTVGTTGYYYISITLNCSENAVPLPMLTVNSTNTDFGLAAQSGNEVTYKGRGDLYVVKHLTAGDVLTVTCQNNGSSAGTFPAGGPGQFTVTKF